MPLSAQYQATLQSVANRIVPADEFPNAGDAGVGDYLEQQFQTDLSHIVPVYEAGLCALQAEAATRYGCDFVALAETEQDELLRLIEADEVQTEWATPPREFFQMVVRHVCEGYYCDARNGGNRDLRSWQMVGFEERCRQ